MDADRHHSRDIFSWRCAWCVDRLVFLMGGRFTDIPKRLREASDTIVTADRLDFGQQLYITGLMVDAALKIEALVEALEWWEQQRTSAIDRASMTAREDPEVLALCNKYGYGAVMDSASRQWVKKDSSGAFFIGGCVGDISARTALNKANN